ncbi:MAG: amidohydrolase family protein, partial [Deltaproteobacteria bacterium]|nr:amidohydrolase family protein [Deltaproteobacteria bacterium]
LEAGADWLPYMVQRMDQYYAADSMAQWEILPKRPCSEYLRDGNVYFTSEGDERLLPIVLEYLGEDHMMASADMPHTEARENTLEEIKARNDITEAQKEKILSRNAIRFFGL